MKGSVPILKRALAPPLARVLEALVRLTRRRAGVVLVYHEVAERGGDPRVEILPAHGGALFVAQLEHLRRRYRVVSARDLPGAVERRRRGERFPVSITFDDDLASHVAFAQPALSRLGLPATFFLTGASLSATHSFWWERLQRAVDRGVADASLLPASLASDGPIDLTPGSSHVRSVAEAIEQLPPGERDSLDERLATRLGPDPPDAGLRAGQVRALSAAGFEIGFHTRRHYRLPVLDDEQLETAMKDGAAELASASGQALLTVGYPHGKADRRVAAAARSAGFDLGFKVMSTSVDPSTHPLLIPRMQPTHSSVGQFALEMARALVRRPG